MKAGSKAQKRRGRKVTVGIDRLPNGRPRRYGADDERSADIARATVVETRMRHYNITPIKAKLPEYGYVLGRIYLNGGLGETVYDSGEKGRAESRLDAGQRYAIDMARYYGLTGIPFPSPRAQDLFRISSHPGDDDEDRKTRVNRATSLMMRIEGALLGCTDGRAVATTVKNIALLDIESAVLWPDHMIRLMNRGLDALIFEYGIMGKTQPPAIDNHSQNG